MKDHVFAQELAVARAETTREKRLELVNVGAHGYVPGPSLLLGSSSHPPPRPRPNPKAKLLLSRRYGPGGPLA